MKGTLYFPLSLIFLLFFSFACSSPKNEGDSTVAYYQAKPIDEVYCLILYVDAPHLDYRSATKFLKSLAAVSRCKRHENVLGHAWISLYGRSKGKEFVLEGGHSGETDPYVPFYFEGMANYLTCGSLKRDRGGLCHMEANPIKYLWTERSDGFFQKGSGGHKPTYAVQLSLSKEQFYAILAFIRPSNYPYRRYSLTEWNCCTFVQKVARLAGLEMDCAVEFPIEQRVDCYGVTFNLWEDATYSRFPMTTPDAIEQALKRAAQEGLVIPLHLE